MKDENIESIIARGISVSPGVVSGPVKIVNGPADVDKIKSGDIMVVMNSNPAYAIGVMNASGLICEGGGVLTHICIVAKEIGIPCLARAEKATELLKENSIITLDADNGTVHVNR
ncbi:MAG: PEP-utilizing enzyme [Acidobacteria bacterium]|jgi:pyruvate,water dikinase|nr:PEP-utilizing enzyme [Acidobacteriota bacterium]